MTTRRQFIGTLGTAVVGGAATLRAARVAAATAPSSMRTQVRIGLQLYTVRELMRRDMERTLAAVARLGYREVEFAGYFGRSPVQVRRMLASAGLRAPSAHVTVPETDDSWTRTLGEAGAAGHSWVVIPWLDESLRHSADDWRRVADRLATLCEEAHRAGLRLAYHNQAYDLASVDGTTPLEILLSGTPPDRVAFELDCYWVIKGGGDPLDILARHPGRFPLMHAKDATAAPERRMVDVGRGTIDFARILATARRHGLTDVFAEHDEPADALASARRSLAALTALLH